MTTDKNTRQYAYKPASKFRVLKNKVRSNFESHQSIVGFIRSIFFYLGKKGVQKIGGLIIGMARKGYLLIENKDVVIIDRESMSLLYCKEPYSFWLSKHTVTPRDYPFIRQHIASFDSHPFFHIVLYIHKAEDALIQTIRSVSAQLYSHYKLSVIADSAVIKEAAKSLLTELAEDSLNAEVLLSPEVDLKDMPSGENFVLRMEPGDMLTPDALYCFADHALTHPRAEVIYADEDLINEKGDFHSPCFKPEWSPDNLLSADYIQQAVVVKASLLRTISQWKTKLENGERYDLILQATECAAEVTRLTRLLYHTKEHKQTQKEQADQTARSLKVLEEAMIRRNEGGFMTKSAMMEGIFIPRYKLKNQAKISIIIPTKDKIDILRVCIDSIVRQSSYTNYEIVLIDNNSHTTAFFDQVVRWKAEMPERFTCVRTEKPFNFAYLMNFGAAHCTGEFYVMLNNDTEVITPDWMELLLEQAQRHSIGIAGAKLLYPDCTVQHAGVVIGLKGLVDHVFVGTPRYGKTYQHYLHRVINYSALTAACFMVSKEKFDQINGFNENFAVEYNDVDFCLRLKEAGYNHVYLPHVELFHHESISRGHPFATKESYNRHLQEHKLMKQTWTSYIEDDPCYSPNLSLNDRNMSVAY